MNYLQKVIQDHLHLYPPQKGQLNNQQPYKRKK